LTLTLRITGVRADGYHLIEAEMVSLALADTLTIDPQGAELTCDGPFARGTPVDSSNLVARALKLAGRTDGVHIHKAIPHGGGLGGGSSDAAAVLRWAGYNDIAGAAAIGADVPFCLVGGRARVRGVGELVEPLPFVAMKITLVIPPLSISTPAAYHAWDNLGGPQSETNDLEAAAISVEPRLTDWRERIEKAAGERPTLAGSGATWFLRGHHNIADSLPDALVVHTQTVAAS
jgi:4-diphosphocytidyl-2-C-methyl-D-erythritol kinase